MNVQRAINQIDNAHGKLRRILAVSDLLTCMTQDPPMDGTIQDTGDLLIDLAQECIQVLDDHRSFCNAILNEEYPDASLSDHQ